MPLTFGQELEDFTLPPLPAQCKKHMSFIVYDNSKLVSDIELKQWFSNVKEKYKENTFKYPSLVRQLSGPGINGDTNDWGALRFMMHKEFNKVKRSDDSIEIKTKKIHDIINKLELFTLQFLEDKKIHLINYYLFIEMCNNYINKSKL